MSEILALLAALTWGGSDFAGGLASRENPPRVVVIWSQLVGLAVAGVAAPLFGGSYTRHDLWWGAGAGLAGGVGILMLYTGLARGRISVVAPVSGVVAAGVPALFELAWGESLRPLTLTGMMLALVAIWLVSAGEDVSTAGFGTAVAAGIGFAGFFILIGETGDGSGLWPLIPARIASITLLSILTSTGAIPRRIRPGSRVKTGMAGAGDMAANVLFLLASRLGPLSVAAVISSLFPAPTVILGRTILGERVRASQWTGLVLAVAAVAMISV